MAASAEAVLFVNTHANRTLKVIPTSTDARRGAVRESIATCASARVAIFALATTLKKRARQGHRTTPHMSHANSGARAVTTVTFASAGAARHARTKWFPALQWLRMTRALYLVRAGAQQMQIPTTACCVNARAVALAHDA